MVESQKLPEYNMDTMPLRRGHILILMIASALGKLGAIIATFIIPPLLQLGGGKLVLIVAIAVLVLGGVITLLVGPLVLKHLPEKV